MKTGLDDFNIYLPQTSVILKEADTKKALNAIAVDLKSRLSGYIEKIDHDFALDNYNYVMNHVADKTTRDIYKVLGPFDHYAHRNEIDDELDARRLMKDEFEFRRSGAQYRG